MLFPHSAHTDNSQSNKVSKLAKDIKAHAKKKNSPWRPYAQKQAQVAKKPQVQWLWTNMNNHNLLWLQTHNTIFIIQKANDLVRMPLTDKFHILDFWYNLWVPIFLNTLSLYLLCFQRGLPFFPATCLKYISFFSLLITFVGRCSGLQA